MSSKITGYAMSPEEIPWLHDVFTTVQDDFDERKTSYILQFLWRDLTSSFDVIGPYFTCAGLIMIELVPYIFGKYIQQLQITDQSQA